MTLLVAAGVIVAGGGGGAWLVHSRPHGAVASASVPVPGDWNEVPEGAHKRIADAIEACRRDPGNADVFATLGRIYQGNVQPALAIASYERAIELGAGDAQTPYLLALLYLDWGRTGKAVGMLRLAERRDPSYAPLHFHLGRSLLDSSDPAAAVDAFRRAIELERADANYQVGLGRALRQAGRLEEAATALRAALVLDPQHAGAHQLLGLTLRALGDDAGANDHLSQVRRYSVEVVRDPWLGGAQRNAASVETHLEWARSYISAGRLESAVKLLSGLAAAHPDRAEVFRRLGEAQVRSGEADGAADAYARAVAIEPYDLDTRTALADILLQQGDLAGAQEAVSFVLATEPDDPNALTVAAAILVRRGRAGEAAARLQSVLDRRGDLAGAHFWMGEAMMALDRPEDARRSYERVVQLQPDSAAARQRLQSLAGRGGDR